MIADPAYGLLEGYSQEDNRPLIVGIMPIVDEGSPVALWGLKEFSDRINNLREMVEQGVVATSKEFDPFAIVDHGFGGEESDEEDHAGGTDFFVGGGLRWITADFLRLCFYWAVDVVYNVLGVNNKWLSDPKIVDECE